MLPLSAHSSPAESKTVSAMSPQGLEMGHQRFDASRQKSQSFFYERAQIGRVFAHSFLARRHPRFALGDGQRLRIDFGLRTAPQPLNIATPSLQDRLRLRVRISGISIERSLRRSTFCFYFSLDRRRLARSPLRRALSI